MMESKAKPSISQWSLFPMARMSLVFVDSGVIVFTSPECHSGILAKSRSCRSEEGLTSAWTLLWEFDLASFEKGSDLTISLTRAGGLLISTVVKIIAAVQTSSRVLAPTMLSASTDALREKKSIRVR